MATFLLSNTALSSSSKETTSHQFNFNIPAHSLVQALREFQKQTGTPLLFSTSSVESVSNPPIAGRYSLDEALTILLSDSELVFNRDKDGFILIKPRGAEADSSATLGAFNTSEGNKVLRDTSHEHPLI